MAFYLRKNLKSIDNKWQYKYLDGIKFEQIPDNIYADKRIKAFIQALGDGSYEFISTKSGRKVENRFKITNLNYRAMIDENGKLIITPTKPTKSKPPITQQPKQTQPIPPPRLSKPKLQPQQPSRQTTPKPSFQPLPMQPPEQTSPAQIVPEPSSKQTSPRLPPKQRTAPQTPQLPIQPIIPTTRSTPMQSHEQAQPIQAPIQSTSPAPEKSPTPPPKKAPSSELERKKLVFYRCLDCKIYVLWFQEKAEYICPVCAAEYRIESVCPDCGSKVTPDATRCPNCGEVLEKEEEEEIKVLCFACETKVNWDKKKGFTFCPRCGIKYIILRACPICGNEVTREATMCHKCRKVLKEEEGEYLYPVCPVHENQMEYNDEDGFSCPGCMEGPDQEEEDDDEEDDDEEDDDEEDDDEEDDDEEDDEEEDDEPEELPPTIIKTCPKCGEEFEIPFSEDLIIVLKCPYCGAKGKISNPYFDNGG